MHLQFSKKFKIFDVPVQIPNLNIGIYWHKDLIENNRHNFLRKEINLIFAQAIYINKHKIFLVCAY